MVDTLGDQQRTLLEQIQYGPAGVRVENMLKGLGGPWS